MVRVRGAHLDSTGASDVSAATAGAGAGADEDVSNDSSAAVTSFADGSSSSAALVDCSAVDMVPTSLPGQVVGERDGGKDGGDERRASRPLLASGYWLGRCGGVGWEVRYRSVVRVRVRGCSRQNVLTCSGEHDCANR